jgi:hypothetical protein
VLLSGCEGGDKPLAPTIASMAEAHCEDGIDDDLDGKTDGEDTSTPSNRPNRSFTLNGSSTLAPSRFNGRLSKRLL